MQLISAYYPTFRIICGGFAVADVSCRSNDYLTADEFINEFNLAVVNSGIYRGRITGCRIGHILHDRSVLGKLEEYGIHDVVLSPASSDRSDKTKSLWLPKCYGSHTCLLSGRSRIMT